MDADSRGYRTAEEQARELTRCIRREVSKLSEKWNALIERSDQWQRKLDDSLVVSTSCNATYNTYLSKESLISSTIGKTPRIKYTTNHIRCSIPRKIIRVSKYNNVCR